MATTDETAVENLVPAVASCAPTKVTGLVEGDVKYWCRCGLSANQPWCDGKHKGTGFTPLKWTVPETKDEYYLCNCKQTKNPPLCNGAHKCAEAEAKERQEHCKRGDGHKADCKLCTSCGWKPDF